MMRKTLLHILEVLFSNCASIVSGIAISIFIPKLLSLEEFGYYKTFTLYTTYLGFFSLGIVDGIVLKYGGDEYENLARRTFRSYSRIFMYIQLAFFSISLLLSTQIDDLEVRFMIQMLGINMMATNLVGYYQQISQIIQRFKEYSLMKMIHSGLNIVVVLIWGLAVVCEISINHRMYITGVVMVNAIIALWYMYIYREITWGNRFPIVTVWRDVIRFLKNGIPLLLANMCSTLILTIDRQFVNILFDAEIYAVYAFAYSMVSLITVATSAIAVVIYPMLKRSTYQSIKDMYSSFASVMLALMFGMLLLYYPLERFIVWFLPAYKNSIQILRIIFPSLPFSTCITVVMHNYYKTLGKNVRYFMVSMGILIISLLVNTGAYMLFGTTASISMGSVLCVIIWYVLIERLFVLEYGYSRKRNLIYSSVMTTAFYCCTFGSSNILGFVVYFGVYLGLTFLVYRGRIKLM